MTRIVIGTAVVALIASIAAPSDGAIAQTLEASPVFEGAITAPTKNGATQPAKISVQSWELQSRRRGAGNTAARVLRRASPERRNSDDG
jgi:hypothetical protein